MRSTLALLPILALWFAACGLESGGEWVAPGGGSGGTGLVDAAAGVALLAGVQDVLDPVVEVLGDDGLVPTVVDDALEVDLAEVVDIAEHLGELVLGHRLGGAPGWEGGTGTGTVR